MSSRYGARPAPPVGSGTAVADLHTHSLRSDGVLEPAELVRQAYAAGVRLLAIADHDNLAAFRELMASDPGVLPAGLELVPAVEINAVSQDGDLDLADGELHVLGLGVDPDDDSFEAALARQRSARKDRFTETVHRLREIGMPVEAHLPAGVFESDDALGRPTLARALVAAGKATSVEDAFKRVLGYGLPGYVPRTGMSPTEAIRAIREAGGLASLAHFAEASTRRSLMRDLVAEGLNGLETHHTSFSAETRAAMSATATDLGLVETGGSDYHGDVGTYGEAHARLVMPDDLVDSLRAALLRTRRPPGRP